MSEGTLIIRDKENQKQDVADLSRDAEHANGSISPIFDKEKEQQRLQEVQLIGEIGSQAVDIANTYGETEGLKAARDALSKEGVTEPDADASDALKKAYQDALRGTDAYKTTTAKYGTGSDLQRGIQAATAALQGLAGSDLTAALAGASAPELANYIGHGSGLSDEAAVVAHAILGGAVAALQGNSVAAGAAGAATGELAAKAIAGMLYPDVKDLSKLSEEQKQTVSALATISAGMAGGLAGDSTVAAVAGGQAGKNAVENNSLSKKDKINIFDINPILKIGIEGADGDPLKGGGGTAKGKDTNGKSSGAENAATYPKLKDSLTKQNLDNIAKQDPRLDAAVKGAGGKLNYGVGTGTKEDADRLGKIWVGEGARPTSDGSGLVSADGSRIYRAPKEKPNAPGSLNPTGIQANFEIYTKNIETGKMDKIGNGHMNISGGNE